jgi:hypothetical protein
MGLWKATPVADLSAILGQSATGAASYSEEAMPAWAQGSARQENPSLTGRSVNGLATKQRSCEAFRANPI